MNFDLKELNNMFLASIVKITLNDDSEWIGFFGDTNIKNSLTSHSQKFNFFLYKKQEILIDGTKTEILLQSNQFISIDKNQIKDVLIIKS